LLQIEARYPEFPIVLETYRELLRDVFDMTGLLQVLNQIRSRIIRIVTSTTERPSPFASSLMFGYVGNFMYEGDAPLAERRAQALAVDQNQLRELLGESELRELLDPEIIAGLELRLQSLEAGRKARNPDQVHDLLLRLGDLSSAEIAARSEATNRVEEWLKLLAKEKRNISV